MNAVIETYLAGIGANLEAEYGDQPKIAYAAPGEGMWLMCKVTDPQSAVDRNAKVNVYIPPNVVLGLLKELRTAAIRARQKTMVDP